VPAAAPPSIGPKLRKARIDRSLSIEESAWRTRIRPDTLRALEDEEFDAIGHQAFVRTNLCSYARFLGMDPSSVAEEYEARDDVSPQSSIEELDRKNRVAQKPRRPKWLIAAIVSGAGLITAAALGVLGGQTEKPATAPLVLGTQLAKPAPVIPKPVTAATARVTLELTALADTRVSVLADGKKVFDGTLASGDVRTFRARSTIDVVAADGGTIRLMLNGKDIGTAGRSGAVFRARYGPQGRIDKA
jgi:cytoskeleton protein RodZ